MANTETVPENSPKAESQSNGSIESAIRELAGMHRTLKDAIETKIGEKLGPDHPMLPWIVEYSGTVITRYRVGKDGRTAYCRIKGKNPSNKVVPLGEKVLYMPLKSAGKKNKLAVKFKYGVFVGVHPRTSEALVANEHGTFRARTVKRLTEDKRWDVASLRLVKGVPWDLVSEEKTVADIPVPSTDADVPPPPVPPEMTTRRMYIKRKDVEKFGMTPGCPGCASIAKRTTTMAHNDKCRERIQKCLEETIEGAERVEKRRLKETEAMAEYGERLMKYHKADDEDVKEQQPSRSSSSGMRIEGEADPEQKRPNEEAEEGQDEKRRRLMAAWGTRARCVVC